MSSKKPKQRMRPVNPAHRPGRPAQSDVGRIIAIVVGIGAVAAVMYAVSRPPSSPTRTVAPAVTNAPVTSTAATKPPAQPTPQRPTPPPVGPLFDAGNRVYDFGRADAGSQVECRVAFTNSGTATLEVSQVTPGCSCMKAGAFTKQLQPGETGTLSVTVDTSHYTGLFAKSVFVTCNDAAEQKIRLELRGDVWRALEITPPSAVLSLSAENPSNAASVKIISHLDEPLTLSDLQISLPNLAIELQTNAPGKEYQINVHTMPPLPTANQQGRITFKTSAASVPTTNVHVGVNYQPVLQALPFQLRLPPPPYAQPFTVQAWVRNNGTNALVISEAKVNFEGVEIEHQNDAMNRGERFTLKFPAGFTMPADIKPELVVKTTNPHHPELRVPIIKP